MTLDLDELERHAQDAASHGEVELYRSITPQSVLALIERVRGLEARWRAAWCIHFGRVVNADNPRDCVTLKDPDPCDKCQQWLKEHST